ncbi:MAG: class I SAM-dependent methyltransferase [Chitinophagales bacterium]|jgi:hypothetical protein
MKDIRPLYETYGAEEYYRLYGEGYENPHEPIIRALVQRNLARWDCSGGVLDFCAGGGEVTRALLEQKGVQVRGCDPYTYALYERLTGCPCDRWSFMEVIKGADLGHYSLIISSFALHLCPEKELFSLVWALFMAAPVLVVITPHKRPALEELPGIELVWEDFELTERGKKVRLKVYQRMV